MTESLKRGQVGQVTMLLWWPWYPRDDKVTTYAHKYTTRGGLQVETSCTTQRRREAECRVAVISEFKYNRERNRKSGAKLEKEYLADRGSTEERIPKARRHWQQPQIAGPCVSPCNYRPPHCQLRAPLRKWRDRRRRSITEALRACTDQPALTERAAWGGQSLRPLRARSTAEGDCLTFQGWWFSSSSRFDLRFVGRSSGSDKVCHQGRIEDMSADLTRRIIRNPRQWILFGTAQAGRPGVSARSSAPYKL